MKLDRILLLGSLFFIAFLTAAEAHGQNQQLRELAQEDQDSRTGSKITRTDDERIKLVLSLIAEGALKVPEDKANAALVLQHTRLTFCNKQLKAVSPHNYLLAHYLAKSAFEEGYKKARFLVPATLDRYLTFTEGYQKYGTSRLNNQETGEEELVPIDRKTPDSERAKYGVPPLAELLKHYREQKPTKP